MSLRLHHNSREALYRAPSGAQACGTAVLFRLKISGGRPEAAYLRIWWQNSERKIPMAPGEGDPELYEARYSLPDSPGLLWYFFIVEANGQRHYYGNADDRLGGPGRMYGGEPPSFQITVYDPAFKTPEWMRRGIMYQIMVDRFSPGNPRWAKRLGPDARMHPDWYEPPYLELDALSGDNQALDFFGGDLEGVRQKLPYLRDLGVTVIYFNPIFQARSNHKYDTGDYKRIDPMFGDEEDFKALCREAREMGIRILLDGVFSHTGADSRYFDRYGRYGGQGAYQRQDSPYASWYRFRHWPEDYDCWWGFPTLPNVNEMDGSYLDFIIRDPDAVAARWLRKGASGWRLDVADELPMAFIRMLRSRVKGEDAEAALLGEVWEDASNKVSYGRLRSYCLGESLDSVMNYPMRDELIGFMLGRVSAPHVERRLSALQENYPAPFFYSLMNLMGSHDRARILNILGGLDGEDLPREARRGMALGETQLAVAKRRMAALWRFICALPGMPCLFYGDEAGLQGMADPFCRAAYPWGREDPGLLEEIRGINRARLESPILQTGHLRLFAAGSQVLCALRFAREGKDAFGDPLEERPALFLLNRSEEEINLSLDAALMPEAGRSGPLEVALKGMECRGIWL